MWRDALESERNHVANFFTAASPKSQSDVRHGPADDRWDLLPKRAYGFGCSLFWDMIRGEVNGRWLKTVAQQCFKLLFARLAVGPFVYHALHVAFLESAL